MGASLETSKMQRLLYLCDKIYGRLVINNTVRGDIEYPLYSEEDIEKAGFFKKITSALSFIIFGGNAE